MKVWIDQDLCVGNGICEDLCPDVFQLVDAVAYVRDAQRVLPPGPGGMAIVPPAAEDAAIEAAEQCPAECIFVELD